MKAKIILLIFSVTFLLQNVEGQIPNCDATVPVFYIDFTNAITDSTVTTSSVSRNGNCCSSVPPELCVLFTVTTGANTAAIVFGFGAGCPLPNGSILYQVDCGPHTYWTDTTIITTPGIHYLTYCKPGNFPCSYTITSLIQAPTGVKENEINYSSLTRDLTENYFLNLNLISPSSFTLNIFSVDGKNISEKKYSLGSGNHQILVFTNELDAGIYFCRVLGGGINRSFKFIK
jgi:hypothetical protein